MCFQNYATNGAVPATNAVFLRGRAGGRREILAHRPGPGRGHRPSTEPYFGLIDEGSKLNLNTVNTNVLSYLPNMTMDFANAIMDWRGTNGIVSLDYALARLHAEKRAV